MLSHNNCPLNFSHGVLAQAGEKIQKAPGGTFSGSPSSDNSSFSSTQRSQILCIISFYGAVCGEIRVSLQWEASDNKQELDLRGSRLASFDETRELWTKGKLNWTAELSLRNAKGGGGGRGGCPVNREMQHDPTCVKHNQVRNDLKTAGKPSWPHQTSPSFIQIWVYHGVSLS